MNVHSAPASAARQKFALRHGASLLPGFGSSSNTIGANTNDANDGSLVASDSPTSVPKISERRIVKPSRTMKANATSAVAV